MKLCQKLLCTTAIISTSLIAQAKDLATVGDLTITEKSYIETAKSFGPRVTGMLKNPKFKKELLNHLIDNHLLVKLANKDGVEKSPEFKAKLENQKKQLLANTYLEKYIKKNSTPKLVKAYFNKNKAKYSTPEEVKASHILIKDKKQAEKILKLALKPKADFAALAKKHSEGPSKTKGGDLGFFGKGRMIPEFEKVAFKLKKGTVNPKVVKTKFGHHIIKVTDKKAAGVAKFSDTGMSDKVKADMSPNLRMDLLKDLRKSAKVKINEENLKNLKI